MRQTSTERPQAVAVSAGIKEWYLTVNTDIRETENGYEYLSKSVTLDHFPTTVDIKQVMCDNVDIRTNEEILSGFVWTLRRGWKLDKNGQRVDMSGQQVKVWFSEVNQLNFAEDLHLAERHPELILPLEHKISEDKDGKAIYEIFEDFATLDNFYACYIDFKNRTLKDGWVKKDNVIINNIREIVGQ